MGFDFVNSKITQVGYLTGSISSGSALYNPPVRVGFQVTGSFLGRESASFLFINGILVATGSSTVLASGF